MTTNEQWAARSDLIHTELDGATLVVDVKTGIYYQLTGVAGAIWQRLSRSQAPTDELIQLAGERGSVRGADLRQQVLALMQLLAEEKLLTRSVPGALGLAGAQLLATGVAAFAGLGELRRFTNLEGFAGAS